MHWALSEAQRYCHEPEGPWTPAVCSSEARAVFCFWITVRKHTWSCGKDRYHGRPAGRELTCLESNSAVGSTIIFVILILKMWVTWKHKQLTVAEQTGFPLVVQKPRKVTFHIPPTRMDLAPRSTWFVVLCSLLKLHTYSLLCAFPPVSLCKWAALICQNLLCLNSQIAEMLGNFQLQVGGGGGSGVGPKSLHF